MAVSKFPTQRRLLSALMLLPWQVHGLVQSAVTHLHESLSRLFFAMTLQTYLINGPGERTWQPHSPTGRAGSLA